jgi:hypothetical protein
MRLNFARRRARLHAATFAVSIVMVANQGVSANEISGAQATALVRWVFCSLDQANKTGNYTVLRDIGASNFQSNSASRLSELFSIYRKDNIDMIATLVVDPKIQTITPMDGGVVRIAGAFPVTPKNIIFDTYFALVGGIWKISALSINFSAPIAPAVQKETPATFSKDSTKDSRTFQKDIKKK